MAKSHPLAVLTTPPNRGAAISDIISTKHWKVHLPHSIIDSKNEFYTRFNDGMLSNGSFDMIQFTMS